MIFLFSNVSILCSDLLFLHVIPWVQEAIYEEFDFVGFTWFYML